jgi:DNA repair exonuclease SbcCD ATPase subunit
MTTFDLHEILPESSFKDTFKNFNQINHLVNKLQALHQNLKGRAAECEVYKQKSQQAARHDQQVLDRLLQNISIQQKKLDEIQDPELNKKCRSKLNKAMNRKAKLEERISELSVERVILSNIDSYNYEVLARELEQWTRTLCQWFETSSIGPGTLRFNGLKYTALNKEQINKN